MKLIGYWMESLRDMALPLPQELVGDWSKSDHDAVCTYLSRGIYWEGYSGYSWCRFRCGIEHDQTGSQEFTDGEWIWPEGLLHYVRDHRVRLPEDFISKAISGKPPSQPYEVNPSLDYWLEWSKTRRSPQIRERLADTLTAVKAAEPEFIEKVLSDRLSESNQEIGPEKCMFAGCMRRALLGNKICIRHSFDDDIFSAFTYPLYAIPHDL